MKILELHIPGDKARSKKQKARERSSTTTSFTPLGPTPVVEPESTSEAPRRKRPHSEVAAVPIVEILDVPEDPLP